MGKEIALEDIPMGSDSPSLAESGEDLPQKKPIPTVIRPVEEPRERKERRLAMSGCCVHQTWEVVKQLTMDDYDEDDLTRWGVLYDPTLGLRKKFLHQKHRPSLEAFAILKEAPAYPYIRSQRPKCLDIPGKHSRQPTIVRKSIIEPDSKEIVFPTTYAYTKEWSQVSNENFASDEKFLDKKTQTDFPETASSFSTETSTLDKTKQNLNDIVLTKLSQGQGVVSSVPETESDTMFDPDDYPLDDQGNPIGKTTGSCEWCGNPILPIPTTNDKQTALDPSALYCCPKYEAFLNDVEAITQHLEDEHKKKNFFINVSSGRTHKQSAADKRAEKKAAAVRAKLDYGIWQKAVGRGVSHAADPKDREKWLKHYRSTREFDDKEVDTHDLPWDPYESAYKVPYPFNTEIFDYGFLHHWKDAWIFARQSEMFIPTCAELKNKLPPPLPTAPQKKKKPLLKF